MTLTSQDIKILINSYELLFDSCHDEAAASLRHLVQKIMEKEVK
jgi:hypothetical protein